MSDKPAKLSLDTAMSLQEAERLLIQAGVPESLLKELDATAQLGREVSQRGDLDFAVGALIEEIRLIKDAQKWADELYKVTTDPKIKADILERRSKQSNALCLAVKELAKLQQQNLERHRKTKKKAQSFSPDQVVVPVQVNANITLPSTPSDNQSEKP